MTCGWCWGSHGCGLWEGHGTIHVCVCGDRENGVCSRYNSETGLWQCNDYEGTEWEPFERAWNDREMTS